MKSWWQVLGVPRKSDRATIRRAYAKKLRVTNPEDDPQGFMALREAYEAALRWVEYESDWDESDEDENEILADEAFAVETAGELPRPDPLPVFDSPQATPDPHAEAHAAEHEALRRRTAAFDAALRGPWQGDAAALTAQLDAILSAPAMIEIAVRDSIEHWLAELLGDTIPRSDAVLTRAVDAFGWENEGNHPSAVWRILGRLDEWRLIHALRRGDHSLSAGWNALTRADAAGWRRRIGALRPGVPAQVRQLLDLAAYQVPGIAHSFDPAAAAWWQAHLEKPRFGYLDLAAILLGGLAGLLCIAAAPALEWRIAGATLLIAALVFPIVRLRIVAPWRLRRELADEEPGWLADAWPAPWLAAALLLVVFPISLWAAAVVTTLSVAAALWMAVAAGREPRIGSPIYTVLSFGVLAVIGGAAFFALSSPEKLALGAFAAASGLIAASGGGGLAAALWRITRWPTVNALAVVVGLVLACVVRSALPGAPEPLVPWGAAAIAGMVLIGAVRDIADGSPVVPLLPWVRWALWIALVFAAALSTPPTSRSGTAPGDPMKQLEQREPGFAALKAGNPGLHSAVALLRQHQVDGSKTPADVSREIDRLVNTAYRERLPRASAALVAAEMDIRLTTLREYRARDVRACAGGGGAGKLPEPSETLRQRHYRHALQVAGGQPAGTADLAAGREIAGGELLRLAANGDAAAAERLAAAMRGSDVKAKCDARIAFLEALVAQDDADIAKTMRPALTARAAPDSAKR